MRLDQQLLISLLGQLGKDNEHEVLVAARKVDQLMKDAALQWQDVLASQSDFGSKTKDMLLALDGSRGPMKAADDLDRFLELRDQYFGQKMSTRDYVMLEYFHELYVTRMSRRKEQF